MTCNHSKNIFRCFEELEMSKKKPERVSMSRWKSLVTLNIHHQYRVFIWILVAVSVENTMHFKVINRRCTWNPVVDTSVVVCSLYILLFDQKTFFIQVFSSFEIYCRNICSLQKHDANKFNASKSIGTFCNSLCCAFMSVWTFDGGDDAFKLV